MTTTNNLSNLVSSGDPVNEFVSILDDTYEILGDYFDETESIFVALSDFTTYVAKSDLSLFWVNYVSPKQDVEFRRSLPPTAFNENTTIFTTPTVLIGWKKLANTTIQYYWLRIIDGDLNVIITKNIGDIVQATDTFGKDGVNIIKESEHSDTDYSPVVSDNNYYTILKGLSGIISNYVEKNIDAQFADRISNIKKDVTDATITYMDNPIIAPGVRDYITAYPINSSNLDTNMFSAAVAMIHDYIKNIRNKSAVAMMIFVESPNASADSTVIKRICIGKQDISVGTLLYFISNDKGIIRIDVYKSAVSINTQHIPIKTYIVSDNVTATDTIIIPTSVLADILASTSKPN